MGIQGDEGGGRTARGDVRWIWLGLRIVHFELGRDLKG